MAHANYADVQAQLRAADLVGREVESLQVGTTKPVRCRVDGDRERRGWYWLHEIQGNSGDILIVGSYGVWRGDNQNTQRIELRKSEVSDDQRAALRKRLAEDRKRVEADRKREAARAAKRAAAAWAKCEVVEDHPYLTRKRVQAFGLKVSPQGALIIPLCDELGQVHGLQIIRDGKQAGPGRRLGKEFWPAGLRKKGMFHMVGAVQDGTPILEAEGYATAATLHEATGYPVAVAFDAGNLPAVAEVLRKTYPRSPLVICADDDAFGQCIGCEARLVLAEHPLECPACGKPHTRVNTGVAKAEAVALSDSRITCVWPVFADEARRRSEFLERGRKTTDFNDLRQVETLQAVAAQIRPHLGNRGSSGPAPRGGTTTKGGGANDKLRPIQSVAQLLERYALVYAHQGAVFDGQEHMLLSLSDMRDACIRRDLHRSWCESPERNIVRIREVDFDPTELRTDITCNLYGGWPTTPKAGKCDRLLEVLWHMCSADPNARDLYEWVLNWVAYPIKHPGAKMKTAVVVHGPQGTGKNLFFEAVMAIYGQYGDVIDQQAIETQFNDWASRKLFMVADEVIARSEIFHVKNKLKALITGDRIRINPKTYAAYWERNHVNLVFLSNEAMPVVLEEDDRRHCVIWTPPKREPEFYKAVMEEIRNGGIEALHHYLSHRDTGEFTNASLPPLTAAKSELINLAMDSPLRFYDALVSHDIRGLKPGIGLAVDWFEIYTRWCRLNNLRAAPMPKFVNALKRHRGVHAGRERYLLGESTEALQHSVLFLGDELAPPDGKDRRRWIAGHVVATAALLDDYKAATK